MSEKSEALRLANFLEIHWCNVDMPEAKAAAELRRQHEEITELRHGAGVANQTIAGLVAQRDALLEALKKAEENGCATVYANEDDECGERGCCGVMSYKPHADDCWVTMARAAIKKAEEGK